MLQSSAMPQDDYPYSEQGKRLRWLRQAEGISTGVAFAIKLNWPQSAYSQFETGKRRIPAEKALQLVRTIPGFDPLWLWEGDKKGLSFDLRRRMEAEEGKEPKPDDDDLPQLSRRERQDI